MLFVVTVTSLEQLQDEFNVMKIIWVFMAATTVLGLLALFFDYKYWTKSTLTMRNICCAAILIHFVTPLLIGQQSAYDTYTGDFIAIADNNATQITLEQQDQYFADLQAQYEQYLRTLRPEELVGVVFGGILGIFIGLISCAVYIVFPMAKAVKCFKLKKEEGVDNDMVALFEVIIVMTICGIIGYDYGLMQYFLKYVGMGIFIPQIIINCCLDNKQTTPKLPLVVYLCLILDGTCASIMNYNISEEFEITINDVIFWCRDVVILTILFCQYKLNGVKTESMHLKSE